MFRAWIFLSSWSVLSYPSLIKKFKVLFKKIGSLLNGSALKIAMIVGGIPADLLRTVLCISFVIRSNASSNSPSGICYKTFQLEFNNFVHKREKLSAVFSIAPLCLNENSIWTKF